MKEHDVIEVEAEDDGAELMLGEQAQVRLAVTLTNVDIPFGRMVVIILKWMLASIPALALLWVILLVTAIVLGAVGIIPT